MKISRMGEVLERLPLDSREQGRIMVDRVTRNFLVTCASHAAGADPEQTIHDALARRGPVTAMNDRRFPPPWTVEEQQACFVLRDHDGQQLAYVYFEDEPGHR